jgi:hypothetical protein
MIALKRYIPPAGERLRFGYEELSSFEERWELPHANTLDEFLWHGLSFMNNFTDEQLCEFLRLFPNLALFRDARLQSKFIAEIMLDETYTDSCPLSRLFNTILRFTDRSLLEYEMAFHEICHRCLRSPNMRSVRIFVNLLELGLNVMFEHNGQDSVFQIVANYGYNSLMSHVESQIKQALISFILGGWLIVELFDNFPRDLHLLLFTYVGLRWTTVKKLHQNYDDAELWRNHLCVEINQTWTELHKRT